MSLPHLTNEVDATTGKPRPILDRVDRDMLKVKLQSIGKVLDIQVKVDENKLKLQQQSRIPLLLQQLQDLEQTLN